MFSALGLGAPTFEAPSETDETDNDAPIDLEPAREELSARLDGLKIPEAASDKERETAEQQIAVVRNALDGATTEAGLSKLGPALDKMTATLSELSIVVTAREERRAHVLTGILGLVPPLSARGGAALAVLKRSAIIRKSVGAAATFDEIKALEADIKLLAAEIEELTKREAARNKAATALAAGEAAVKAALKKLIEGSYNEVVGMLRDATQKFEAAKSVSDYEKVETALAAIQPYIVKVEGYLSSLPRWRYDTELYVSSLPEGSAVEKAQRNAMNAWRETLLAAANGFAVQGDLAKAQTELDKFASGKTTYVDPSDSSTKDIALDSVRNTAAQSFAQKVAAFVSAHSKTITELKRVRAMGAPNVKAEYTAIKKKGYSQGDWATAETELDAFAVKLEAAQKTIDKFRQYEAILVGAASGSDAEAALATVRTQCSTQNFAAALATLSALDTKDGGSVKTDAEFATKKRRLSLDVKKLTAALTGAALASVTTPWAAAETETEHQKKMEQLANVEALLPALITLIAAKDPADALRARHDAGDTFKILKEPEDDLAAGHINKAATAYAAAPAAFEALAKHHEAAATLRKVRDALPASQAEMITEISAALAAADSKAKAFAWSEAEALLDARLNDPTIHMRVTEIELYERRRAAVAPIHTRILGKMTQPKAKEKLVTPWSAIEQAATVAHNYLEAVELLRAHATLLETAGPYINAAFRCRKALKAMHSVADKLSAAAPNATAKDAVLAAIYPNGATKLQLTALFAAAEKEAGKGDYAAATPLFDAINVKASAGMKEAGKALEHLDDGHYFSAHGPDVPPDETKSRIVTGKRPDGVRAPASKSSQFLDVGDFMATLELAETHPDAVAAGVGTDTLKRGSGLEVVVFSDAQQDVGISFVGGLAQQGLSQGEFGKTNVFENYEEITGLTRVQTKFIFRLTDPDPSKNRKVKSFDDYDAKYKAVAGNADVPSNYDYPGRWVINQHFPTPPN